MTSRPGFTSWDEEKNRSTLALRLDADLLHWFRQQRVTSRKMNPHSSPVGSYFNLTNTATSNFE